MLTSCIKFSCDKIMSRGALVFLLATGLCLPAQAVEQDTCVSDSKTLSDFVKCVAAVEEYARQSELYPERIREFVKNSGINRPDATGETALGLSAGSGLSAIVSELLKLGADPEQPNARGQTPLILNLKGMTSVNETRVETLELLLGHGTCVDVSDTQGTTPLMLAAQVAPGFKVETLKAILARKPPVWVIDKQGENVLFYLVRSYSLSMESEDWIQDSFVEVANLLLTQKPDLNWRNREGKTVSQVAREQGALLLAERLDPE